MSARTALQILDSMFDLFKEMGSGLNLGLNVREIVRRLHHVQAEIPWTGDRAKAANTLRARAAFYAARYVPDHGSAALRARNKARLDHLVSGYSELRLHLEQAETEERGRALSGR